MEEDDEDAERGTSSTDALLRALIAAFSPPCFAELGARVDEVIAESTVHERGARTRRLQVGGMWGVVEGAACGDSWHSHYHFKLHTHTHAQECFAVNAGIDGLLDVARKTFLQSVEDIYELATRYSKVCRVFLNGCRIINSTQPTHPVAQLSHTRSTASPSSASPTAPGAATT
jgi:hypothetical protein